MERPQENQVIFLEDGKKEENEIDKRREKNGISKTVKGLCRKAILLTMCLIIFSLFVGVAISLCFTYDLCLSFDFSFI